MKKYKLQKNIITNTRIKSFCSATSGIFCGLAIGNALSSGDKLFTLLFLLSGAGFSLASAVLGKKVADDVLDLDANYEDVELETKKIK